MTQRDCTCPRLGGKGTQFDTMHGLVTAKPAKTRINMERGWALHKAEDLVKAVNGEKVFAQSSDELG